MRAVFFTVLMLAVASPLYAEEQRDANDNFITNAISDAFSKLGDYTSGRKEIVTDDAKGIDEGFGEGIGHERDALGTRMPMRPLTGAKKVQAEEKRAP